MATSTFTYPKGEVKNMSDQDILTISGLPSIPANATLNNVYLYFDAYRENGAKNGGKVTVRFNTGTQVYENSVARATRYDDLKVNLTGYITNSGGTLSYNNGASSLIFHGYQNYQYIPNVQSDWTIDDVRVVADYTPHAHSYTSSSSVIVNPTCETAGTRRKYCSCGAYTDETIPALGHSYVDIVTPPTCTSQGYTTHNCGGCSHSYVDTYVAALGHNYVATNVVQPSGTSPGYTQYTCSNGCGGSERRDYTNSISVKAGTGCSQITIDGAEPTTEGATRNFVLWQNSVFTLYSYPKTGYVFEKWIIKDANGSASEDTRQNLPVTLSSNISVEAVYKLATYTATFLNGDGSTLETVTVTHGSTPVCSKTPTKASTDKYIYTWDNANPWTPAIGALIGNQTYTPNFISKAYFTLSFDYNELASAYDCELVTGEQVGSGLRFTEGSVVKVTAKVKQGYVLSHWEDGSTDNPRLVTITGDIILAVTITPILPKFTSVQMLYQNQQISETNKVLANQFFRIVVGVE
jgi:hypothetical protein